MLETGTSGLMSGEGKRVGRLYGGSVPRPSSTLPLSGACMQGACMKVTPPTSSSARRCSSSSRNPVRVHPETPFGSSAHQGQVELCENAFKEIYLSLKSSPLGLAPPSISAWAALLATASDMIQVWSAVASKPPTLVIASDGGISIGVAFGPAVG
jgi:hypothetical protein